MIKVGGCSIGGGTIEIRELELDGCRFAPLGPCRSCFAGPRRILQLTSKRV